MAHGDNFEGLGDKIRQLRLQKGYTQQNMADELGISQSKYHDIENTPENESLKRISEIAKLLGTNVAQLLKALGSNTYIHNNSGHSPAGNHGNITINYYPVELIEELLRKVTELSKKPGG